MDKPKKEIKISAPDTTTLIIAAIVVIVTIVLLYVYKKKKTSRTDIILAGLCESGKTTIFSLLMGAPDKETFTSIKENVGDYTAKNGFTRIIDTPGHERLRAKYLDEFKFHARGLVFVVDSLTVQKDVRDVADFLYTLLGDEALFSTPVLILCNKQDETMAKSSSVIKSILEKELNLVRATRTRQLDSVDSKSGPNVFLGKNGKDFEFTQLSQNIEIAESSAKTKKIDALQDWLDRVV